MISERNIESLDAFFLNKTEQSCSDAHRRLELQARNEEQVTCRNESFFMPKNSTINIARLELGDDGRREDKKIVEVAQHNTYEYSKFFQLFTNIFSHHVKILNLATTVTLCKKADDVYIFDKTPAPVKAFLCSATGAAALVSTGKVTTWIGENYGNKVLNIASFGYMGLIAVANIFLPKTLNKFNQEHLATGVTLGYLMKEGLSSITTVVTTTKPGLESAENDAITSGFSLDYALHLSGGLWGGFASTVDFNKAQLLYRALDIPLNSLVSTFTASLHWTAFGLLTAVGLAWRCMTLDFTPGKSPAEIFGTFAGLALTPSLFSFFNSKNANPVNSTESIPDSIIELSETVYDEVAINLLGE